MPQLQESSTDIWRQALAELERLDAMGQPTRAQALAELARALPNLHAAVQTLANGSTTTGGDGAVWPGAQALATAAEGFAALDLTGVQAGAYRFVRPVGAGGMGQVWLAERTDGRYHGEVAIKLLAWSSSPALVERFKREGQLLGRLVHPNIARLLDAGALPAGPLYLVLEYIDGQRIDTYADALRAPLSLRLQLFLDVCAAVSVAHANLVVHRDLKPSNILVTAQGQVKLLDFGIAKLLETEDAAVHATELTQLGGLAMTLEYAAPEQVAGAPLTTAADVYALGGVLYRLLCGAPPYRSTSSRAELAQAVLHEPPPALAAQPLTAEVAAARASTPERLTQALRGDLDTIVQKALKKQPEERYASVQALADDLRRHLAHEPVQARPDSLGYRTRKFVRRNRVQVGALTAVFASLAAGIGATAWQWQQATREAERTRSVVQMLTQVFSEVHPNRTGSARVPMTELLERGWRRAQQDLADDPHLHGEVARALGLAMHESGESEATAQALQTAHAHLQRTGRTDRVEYLEVSAALASVWMAQGQHGKALAVTEEAILAARASGASEASETVLLQAVRGGLLRHLQRLEEARIQLEDAAATALRVHGAQHPARARALTELADIARQQGRFEDARKLYEQTVSATADRQAAAAIRLHGAVLDIDMGLYADAANKLQALVVTMTELIGDEAQLTHSARSWLAEALSHAGHHSAAQRELDVVLPLAETGRFGPEEAPRLRLAQARLQLRGGRADLAEPAARAALHHFETLAPRPAAAARARGARGRAAARWLARRSPACASPCRGGPARARPPGASAGPLACDAAPRRRGGPPRRPRPRVGSLRRQRRAGARALAHGASGAGEVRGVVGLRAPSGRPGANAWCSSGVCA